MSRQFTVSPIGLVTQPNKIGVYPEGAMSQANTLVMRSPGKLTPLRVPELWPASFVTAGSPPMAAVCIAPLGTQYQLIGGADQSAGSLANNLLLYSSAANSVIPLTAVESQYPLRARFRPVLFRDRLFLMNSTGLTVLDALDGSDSSMRWAGLPQPIGSLNNYGSGTTVTVGKAVAYTVIFRRKYSDGYELISAPAPFLRAKSNIAGFNSQPGIRAYFNTGIGGAAHNGIIAGDLVELYRTREVDAPSDVSPPDPGTTCYRVASATITSTDVSNGYVQIRDIGAPDQICGPELYTNPGQETLQSSRFIPPVAECLAEFKGFMFFGNVTQSGTWIGSYPGGIGTLETADQRRNGIGERRITTGTYSTASNVLTGVSAAEMVGVVVGQVIIDSSRLGTQRDITAVGASSITFSGSNASSNGAPLQTGVYDVLEVNGNDVTMTSAQAITFLGAIGGAGYRIVTAETLMYTQGSSAAQSIAYGQALAVSPMRPYGTPLNSIAIRGTNPQNYDPVIPNITATAQTFSATTFKNLIMWSWEQQPECVAAACYAFVGSGEIYQLVTTRDVMWIFASDGLWRFTGYGTRSSGINANWRIDQIDKTLILAGPNAFAVLRDAVFAYTNIGLVKISDAGGVQTISRGVVGDAANLPGRYWSESEDICMAADETLDEVWININTGNFAAATGVSICYIWSDVYKIFTTLGQFTGPTSLLQQIAYDRFQGKMVMAVGVQNVNRSPAVYRHPATGNYDAWTADYQPQFGPDPATTKTWLEMEVICGSESVGVPITPRFNGTAYTSNPLELYSQQNDARAFFGIDIEAPATANQIAPGVSGAVNAAITELRAIAMHWEPYSEERAMR